MAAERMHLLRRLPLRNSHGLSSAQARLASSTVKPIPARVLEQPDAFRPPSHGARIRKPRPSYGPALSQQEIAAQKTKQYPHMMPPEGSFMHKFLTSRTLHTSFTLSVLVALTLIVMITNFLHSTPYRDELPPNNLFWSHPFSFLGRWWEVYQMHTDYITQKTMAKREAKTDDVRKRSEYRKAHGLDDQAGFGGWTFRKDKKAETLADGEAAAALREGGGEVQTAQVAEVPPPQHQQPQQDNGEYVDFGGEKRKVKKWLGIW